MINTYSIFYYIDGVTLTNTYLNFNEGAGQLTAQVEVGDWTPSELARKVEDALNSIGTQAYTCTFNRNDRTFTISAPSNFSLLSATGTQASLSIFSLIGLSGADKTGANSYTGIISGYYYEPQFKLQSYVDPEDLQDSVNESVNITASGSVKVVKFGVQKFMECNISFITNIDQGVGGPIKTNLVGIEQARAFMRFLVNKSPVEFMKDIDDRSVFNKLLLEKTSESQTGTGYRLMELYSKNLPNYYETQVLKFRVIEG